MISDLIACDVHRIGAAEPYPADYANGLAIQGETVTESLGGVRANVKNWLRAVQLLAP